MASTIRDAGTQHWVGKALSRSNGRWLKRALGAARKRDRSIYRVTPDGATAMIGRTLSEEGAAALRARFLVSNPQTPQEMLTAALGTTAPVDLGRGLTLTRRRVAGEMRLELGGADKGMIDGLKAMGCFTEIIAFQLRVFLPHGDGVDTGSILARIVGQGTTKAAEQAA